MRLKSVYVNQSVDIANKLFMTIPFILGNKLWKGFFRHKLVMTVSLITAIVIPISVYKYIDAKLDLINNSGAKASNFASMAMHESVSFSSLFEGGNKWLVIILIQMLVVYFSNRTIEVLSGVTIDISGKEMIKSQFRNILVVIRNWVLELVIGVGIAILIGILGPAWMEDVLKYAVGCYFVGYVFIDNYNNTFGLTIKESAVVVRHHAGAALVVGLVARILLLLPVVGALLVSFICSVAATWYMHSNVDNHAGEIAFAE